MRRNSFYLKEDFENCQQEIYLLLVSWEVSIKKKDYRLIVRNYLLESNDQDQRLIGLILLNIYLSQPKNKFHLSFLSEIIQNFLVNFKNTQDHVLSEYCSILYGKLIKFAPKGIITKFERDAKTLIMELVVHKKTSQQQQRLTIYKILYQLIKNEKYIVLKEIRKSGSIPLFNKILNESGETQQAALKFIKEFIIEICKQERDEQHNQFYVLFKDIIQDIKDQGKKSFYYLRGVFILSKELFTHLDKKVFAASYVQISSDIIAIASENIRVKKLSIFQYFMDFLPILAKYNPQQFLVNFASQVTQDLLSQLEILEFKERNSLFNSLNKIIQLYSKKEIKTVCVEIFEIAKDFMEKEVKVKNFSIGQEMFSCLYQILKKINWIESLKEKTLDSFVNIMLIYSLNHYTVQIIDYLCNTNEEEFSYLVKIKLWQTLIVVLSINERQNTQERMKIYTKQMQEKNENKIKEKRRRTLEEQKILFKRMNSLNEQKIPQRKPELLSYFGNINCERLIDQFKKELREAYQTNKEMFHTQEKISTALELLAKFSSTQQSKEHKNLFIKDIVINYLESPFPELRKKSASIVFHFSSEKNPEFLQNLSLSNQFIQGMINKLLVIAVSDKNSEVRVETLTTLNSMIQTFNQYLITEENLKRLMICFYDSNQKIQYQSLLIFQKLTPYSPNIIPKIENLIFKLISFLSLKNKNFGQEEINHLKTLQLFTQNSPFYLEGKLKIICEILIFLGKICFQERYQNIMNTQHQEQILNIILKTLIDLFYWDGSLAVTYFDQVSDFCLLIIKNEDRVLVSEAFDCLSQLINSSNLSLYLLLKYDIFEIVIDKMSKNVENQIKFSILKFLGYLGAIENYYIEKINHRRQQIDFKQISQQQIEEEVFKLVRVPLNFLSNLQLKNKKIQDPNLIKFKKFQRNIRITEAHNNMLELQNFEKSSLKTTIKKNKNYWQKGAISEKKTNLNNTVEVSIYSFKSLLQYICEHTLNTLIQLLEENQDQEIILQIIETVSNIIKKIGPLIYQFKDIILPKMLQELRNHQNEALIQPILILIKNFVETSSNEISLDNHYLDQIVIIISQKVEREEYQKDVLDILHTLLKFPKSSLKHKLKDFISSLLDIIVNDPLNSNIDKIFQILSKLNKKDYMYHIIPVFLRILDQVVLEANFCKPPQKIIIKIYYYFSLVLYHTPIKNYFANIIRSSVKILSIIQENELGAKYTEISKKIKKFLIKMIIILKNKILLHLPLMHDFLIEEEQYKDILYSLHQKGYFDVTVEVEVDKEPQESFVQNDECFLKRSLKKVNIDLFTALFDISNNYKNDDWQDWLNKLKVDLIINSPSYVLIECKKLTCLEDIVNKLFKPAFSIVWYQFNDSQKEEVLNNFEMIISNPQTIPILVLKELLELIEFMSHDNLNGLNLDVNKLAQLAYKCLSLPKAIYFTEKEFEHSPEKCSDNLLNLYIQSSLFGFQDQLIEYKGKFIKSKPKFNWFNSDTHSLHHSVMDEQKQEEIDAFIDQIKVNNSFSKWEFTIQKIKDVQKKRKINNEIIGRYGAQAAFHLSKWDQLEDYNQHNTDGLEKNFYTACVSIHKKDYTKAKKEVDNLRKMFIKEGINFSNYSGSYRKLLTLQKISELEQIIKFNSFFEKAEKDELYEFMMGNEEIQQKKKIIKERITKQWEDKLFLIEPNIRYYEETLALRTLFCNSSELLDSYLALTSLSLNKGRNSLFKQIYQKIKNNQKFLINDNIKLRLAFCEMEYLTGEKDEKGLIQFLRELIKKKVDDEKSKVDFFKKSVKWLLMEDSSTHNRQEVLFFSNKIIQQCLFFSKLDFKIYHLLGLCNYFIIKETDIDSLENKQLIFQNAIKGFTQSISLKSNLFRINVIQDLLRIIDLWFNYDQQEHIQEVLQEAKTKIKKEDWLLVVGQIISRLNEEKVVVRNQIKDLLISLSEDFPQNLIFPLLIAKKSANKIRSRVAQKILMTIKNQNPELLKEATIFQEEMIRISVLLEEQWFNGINEAWKYVQENNYSMMKKVLENLHRITNHHNKTLNEMGFYFKFGTELNKAKELIDLYSKNGNEIFLTQAWNFYAQFYHSIEKRFQTFNNIFLENVSEKLLNFKNSKVLMPGVKKEKQIRIKKVHSVLEILKSKRKPRKIAFFGTDNKKYYFLLKGHEDLRQDERVMQFLNLVNDLIKNNINLNYRSLKIVTLYVLPLSVNSGLISWLDNCDTLSQCIRDYRRKYQINMDCEKKLSEHFYPNYDSLSKLKKLEVYRYVCDNTKGQDLKKILWLRNNSAEEWLEYRNNFINSLAVMSMVGYILGLGDRHLSNLMIKNLNGKIVHIDFGDCFETASLRDKLPEKVPFRLTRVLVNAMEGFGIEGTYKETCERIMSLLRSNKESLIAILEEFVRDPLITWRMLAENIVSPIQETNPDSNKQTNDLKMIESIIEIKFKKQDENHSFQVEGAVEMERKQKIAQNQKTDKTNDAAKNAIDRIKKKLNGREFNEGESLSVKQQVKKLIEEATSQENISQAFSGWNPFL